jgi:formylglycine-generating enzyme required for sulfatase activity
MMGRWRRLVMVAALMAPILLRGQEAQRTKPEGTRGGEMVLVPAGPFGMGCNRGVDGHCDPDENPYHSVNLPAYYLDVTETTNAMYAQCVEAGACRPAKKYPDFDAPEQPVVGVSWDDAVTYCKWAGKRLPTEAQWEKGARGSKGLVYPWGNNACGCGCAIQEDNQIYGCGKEHSWPVGGAAKGASPYGALDLSGNVMEWVQDWFDPEYYKTSPKDSPPGPESGKEKIRKGGCYAHVKNYLRASDRTTARPETVSNSTGFRCVAPAPAP